MRKYIIVRKISMALLGHKQQCDLFAQKSVVEKSFIKNWTLFLKTKCFEIQTYQRLSTRKKCFFNQIIFDIEN